jgi:hypothetical protein
MSTTDTTLSPATIADALDAVAECGTLRAYCRGQLLATQERRELFRALRTTHAEAFHHAREVAADGLADECMEIADGCAGRVDEARLQIEVRMRLCAALAPWRYADRRFVEHSGSVELRLTTGAASVP